MHTSALAEGATLRYTHRTYKVCNIAVHMVEQASSYSAVAAERATHLSKAAADYSEGARSQLAGLHLPDTLANLQVQGPNALAASVTALHPCGPVGGRTLMAIAAAIFGSGP